jgi:hypothetical protein
MTDDDRKRFEEERRRQAETMQRLERGFLGAFAAWLTAIARRLAA